MLTHPRQAQQLKAFFSVPMVADATLPSQTLVLAWLPHRFMTNITPFGVPQHAVIFFSPLVETNDQTGNNFVRRWPYGCSPTLKLSKNNGKKPSMAEEKASKSISIVGRTTITAQGNQPRLEQRFGFNKG